MDAYKTAGSSPPPRRHGGPWRDHNVVIPPSQPDPDRTFLTPELDRLVVRSFEAYLTGFTLGLVVGSALAFWWCST